MPCSSRYSRCSGPNCRSGARNRVATPPAAATIRCGMARAAARPCAGRGRSRALDVLPFLLPPQTAPVPRALALIFAPEGKLHRSLLVPVEFKNNRHPSSSELLACNSSALYIKRLLHGTGPSPKGNSAHMRLTWQLRAGPCRRMRLHPADPGNLRSRSLSRLSDDRPGRVRVHAFGRSF